jgi:hypothetical protein
MLQATLQTFGDVQAAESVMRSYIAPVMQTLCVIAGLACTLLIVIGGYRLLSSRGDPEQLASAKRTLIRAVIGLLIVISASTLTHILTNAYGHNAVAPSNNIPALGGVDVDSSSGGWAAKLVSSFIGAVARSAIGPFLKSLAYFTSTTPLVADNAGIFNLWLTIVAITDVVIALIPALIGLHFMSASLFGFEEIEFKHLLGRFGLVFLAANTSVFWIDGVISFSNALIHAIQAAYSNQSVWDTLIAVVAKSGAMSIAALLIMLALLVLIVVLLVYYVRRIIVIYAGAVISPLVCIAWLIPGFRDFTETAAKTYITNIFVLFVHVVLLEIAALMFQGMAHVTGTPTPDPIMSMILGLAALWTILGAQSYMSQLAYMNLGPRAMRRFGEQFVNGVSYVMSHRTSRVSDSGRRRVPGSEPSERVVGSVGTSSVVRNTNKQNSTTIITSSSTPKAKTGTTTVAPSVKKTVPKNGGTS